MYSWFIHEKWGVSIAMFTRGYPLDPFGSQTWHSPVRWCLRVHLFGSWISEPSLTRVTRVWNPASHLLGGPACGAPTKIPMVIQATSRQTMTNQNVTSLQVAAGLSRNVPPCSTIIPREIGKSCVVLLSDWLIWYPHRLPCSPTKNTNSDYSVSNFPVYGQCFYVLLERLDHEMESPWCSIFFIFLPVQPMIAVWWILSALAYILNIQLYPNVVCVHACLVYCTYSCWLYPFSSCVDALSYFFLL